MRYEFYPRGVCSRRYEIELEDGIIKEIIIEGGCNGNLQGIKALITGKKAEDIIPVITGIDCRGRGTSCPDQIAMALRQALDMEKDA